MAILPAAELSILKLIRTTSLSSLASGNHRSSSADACPTSCVGIRPAWRNNTRPYPATTRLRIMVRPAGAMWR